MTIQERVLQINAAIARACDRAQRNPNEVTLIAVSKTHPAQAVLDAIEAGVQHFGENRVEEAQVKIPQVAAHSSQPVHWHMVGHVQSRKAKLVAPLFETVHSVDSVKLASRLAQAVPQGSTLNLFLEVNVSGELTKQGFAAYEWRRNAEEVEQLVSAAREMIALPGVHVIGLMTMAPIVSDMEDARPVFSSLRDLRSELEQRLGCLLPQLSMGMTDDFPVALEEGATMIRIGRAIFGERLAAE